MNTAANRRFTLVELIIFITLAGISALLFRPLMGFVNAKINLVHQELVHTGESFLERPIRYGAMSPTLFGSIEIKEIRIGLELEPLITAESIYMEYSMWGLIRGRGIGAIRNLVLEKPEIHYSINRDSDLNDLFNGNELILPSKCHFTVRNGNFSFTAEETVISISEVFLDGEFINNTISLDGTWQKDTSAERFISFDGSINGLISQDLDQGSLDLAIYSVEGNNFKVGRNDFILSFFDEQLILERKADNLPLDISAHYIWESGGISALFRSDRFLPADILQTTGEGASILDRFAPALALALSGEIAFSYEGYELDTNNLSYHFSLAASLPVDSSSGVSNYAESNNQLNAYSFVGRGDQNYIHFEDLAIEIYHGKLEYTGDIYFNPLLSDGKLIFTNFSLTGEPGINGEIATFKTGNTMLFESSSLSLGQTLISALRGEFTQDQDMGSIILGFDRFRPDGQGIIRASFESRAHYNETPGQIEALLEIRNFAASDIVNMIKPFIIIGSFPDNFIENTSINTDIYVRTDFRSVYYSAPLFQVWFGREAVFSASFIGNERQVDIRDGSLRWQRGEASVNMFADYSNIQNIDFRCSLGYRDFYYDFNGQLNNLNTVTLASAQGFSAVVTNEYGRWSGAVYAGGIPIPFRGSRAFLHLDAGLAYRDQFAWNISLNRLELLEPSRQGELFISGQANQNGLNLERIYYSDITGPLSGSAAAVWNSDFSIIDGSFIISDQDSIEKLSGDVFYQPGNLVFSGTANGFLLDRITAVENNLRITGDMNGSISDEGYYLASFSLDSLNGTIAENDFSLSGLFLLDPERLIVSRVFASIGDMMTDIPYVVLDKNAGRLEAETQIFGQLNEQNIGIFMDMGVNFLPMNSWRDFNILDTVSGIINVQYAYINYEETKEPFDFTFTRTPSPQTQADSENSGSSVIRLSGGPSEMLNAEIRQNGNGINTFFISLNNPSPFQATISGILSGTTFDAYVSDFFIDMGELWKVLPIKKGVNFTEGVVSGDTRIFGSIFDPEFSGTAWASGVSLQIPEFVATEIGPGFGMITFDGSGFSFGPVSAAAGEGFGVVDGWINFSRWKLSFFLDIDIERSIPFDFNISGVMARGDAVGNLQLFQNEDEELYVFGILEADNTEISINIEEFESSIDEMSPQNDLEIITDIQINAGRRVEFFWPNPIRPLLRVYADPGTGVRIISDTRVPMLAMDGNVAIRGGEVYHFQRSFYIREGLLQFNQNDPQVDPRITARAEIREWNEDGPVTIAMIMDNVPLSELENTLHRFESSPALSLLEIYSLLGQVPSLDEAAPENLNILISPAIEMLLQTVVFHRIERQLRNALGLDMFSFRTQILQNAVFEAVRTREPEEQPATMGHYLDNTAIFLGKFIGPQLFVHTMLAFRYDPYREEYGGMNFEPELGLELRTPFFDIRWNFSPMHPENLFMNDQSISLVWQWSL